MRAGDDVLSRDFCVPDEFSSPEKLIIAHKDVKVQVEAFSCHAMAVVIIVKN